MEITISNILSLCPKADQRCVKALKEEAASTNPLLPLFGITGLLRESHFWAQVLHESGGLTRLEENLKYSCAQMVSVFPKYFRTIAEAQKFSRPQALADRVYGGRMGNFKPGDGWRFRGRGLIQITGRSMYHDINSLICHDIEESPDDCLCAELLLPVACAVWKTKDCNELADKDDIEAVTRKINGGLNGIEDRQKWMEKILRL